MLGVARMVLLMKLLVELLVELLMKLLRVATVVTADETAEGSHYCDCWRCPPEGDFAKLCDQVQHAGSGI